MGRLISRRNNLNFFDSVDVRELGLSDILEIGKGELGDLKW